MKSPWLWIALMVGCLVLGQLLPEGWNQIANAAWGPCFVFWALAQFYFSKEDAE